MLGTAIRKSNRVGTLSISGTITSLGSVEVGVGIVISNSICVSVRRGLIRVSTLSISLDYRGMVGRGSVDNWGMVSWGSMDNWGMVSWGSMDNWGMVGWGSMDNWGMSKNSL